jgi:hypothetical protein
MNSSLARFVTPWSYRRAQEELARVQALKARDGDCCRRCRRPIRFDLAEGHDQGPKVETVTGEAQDLDNLVLCHRRCNGIGSDHTGEVQERRRRQNEADLFSKSRKTPRKRKTANG